MKRLAAILLITVLLFSATSCDYVSDKIDKVYTSDENAESTVADPSLHRFIPQDERNGWKDNLISVLSQCDIYDSDLGIFGSFAAGLMDLDLDNTPEVILAYAGGSMGNVSLEIYDLNTGAKLDYYNASHWDGGDNIYLCVAKTNESYAVLSQGVIRIIGADFMYSMGILKADRNSAESYLQEKSLFATWNENEETFYSLGEETVSKADYDKQHEQFLIDYKMIDETQIQLIKWATLGKLEWKDFGFKEGVDPESKQKLVEQMAEALISSSQQFIRYETPDNQNQLNEETKLPKIPAEYNDIINAYIEIAHLTRYKGCTTRGSINDKDYPNVSKEHIDVIFNSLIDGWSWRNGVDGYFAGYAIKDINGDEIPELFLTDAEHTIYALFTLVNGEINSHYFSFYYNESTVALDANGYFYMNDFGKGECEWYEVLRLGKNGDFYGTEFGHYDMTGFGDPDVYNYHCTIDAESSSNEIILTDKEYHDLVASYNEALKKKDPDSCGKPNHVTSTAGLEFYQVITEDKRK